MNILKPQNLHIQELENKYLVHIKEDEKINYCNFENEECNNIKLYEIEFEQCNVSNTEFLETSFIKCEFNNFKVSGCNFA